MLFAGANEPNVHNLDEMKTLMYYYQTFVNAVRGAGGNGTNRWLVLQGGGDTSWLNSLPTDPTPNRLMVEYHCYSPPQFAILSSAASWGAVQYFWGPAYHYSADPTRNCVAPEEGGIDTGFQQLVDQYVSKGIPVLIGEFGAAPKPSLAATNATESAWNRASSYYWHKYVAEAARSHGMSPFFWSTPGSPFDWTSGAVNDAQLISVLTGGAAPPPPNGAPYAPSGLTAAVSNNNVVLSWTAGSGAASYNLYRAAESGYESSIAPVVTGITGTNYTDTNLNSGTAYYYQVAGVNGSGPSGFSAETHATTSGAKPDPAQFNFETDPQRWSSSGSQISGVATSTAQHFAGNQSLAVNFNGSAAGTSSASVGNVAVVPGMTITFLVWIPSGSKITTLLPYMQDRNWSWTSSWYGSLTPNAWNTVALTVPPTAVAPFQNLGLQFTTSAGWTNTCYIDSLSWSTPAPDFILSANPASLTVKGGTNGASAITVTPTNGLNGCYTLSASNLPSGVTATFATNPITGGASTLTFTASNTVTSGTSSVTFNSGAFSFRPLVTQADSTNNFTLKVSDNGTPSMSATQRFAVVVNPLSAPVVTSVSAAGGYFSFSISGQTGPDYAVETSTNLTEWSTVLVTNSPALPLVWMDTNSIAPMRFYRVKLGPPLP